MVAEGLTALGGLWEDLGSAGDGALLLVLFNFSLGTSLFLLFFLLCTVTLDKAGSWEPRLRKVTLVLRKLSSLFSATVPRITTRGTSPRAPLLPCVGLLCGPAGLSSSLPPRKAELLGRDSWSGCPGRWARGQRTFQSWGALDAPVGWGLAEEVEQAWGSVSKRPLQTLTPRPRCLGCPQGSPVSSSFLELSFQSLIPLKNVSHPSWA